HILDNNGAGTNPSSKTVELLPFNSFTKNNDISMGTYGDELIINAYTNEFKASMATVPPKIEKNKKYTLVVTAKVQDPAASQEVKLDFANKQSKEFNVTGEGYQKLELQFITDDNPTGDNGKIRISIKNAYNSLIIKSVEITDEGTAYSLDCNSFTKKGDMYMGSHGNEFIVSTIENEFKAGMATVPNMLEKNKRYTLVVTVRVQNPTAAQGVKLDFANKQSKEFNVTGGDYQKLELSFTTDDNPIGNNGTVNILLKNSNIPLIIKSIEINE
ncbi:TPA: hypothetical protein ROY17_005920, partial [Bacillus thuringiensis]|nr:hypothetical protein [Bacillus thuringiensis]